MNQQQPILRRVGEELSDLSRPVPAGLAAVDLFPGDEGTLDVYRHSCAHLLAHAVTELYPGAQYGVGPAVENGFYYDFLVASPFTPEDLERIAGRMRELVAKNQAVERLTWTRAEAESYFREKGQHLKLELIADKVVGDEVTVYRQGDFVDLCRGPHLPATGHLRHFKLLSVAAAYWKGDERNASMQRIYGAVFATAEGLQGYLDFLAQAQARDHRTLGRELDLFSLQEEAGPGLVYWHPKGARIRYQIEEYWKKRHYQGGYELLYTPHIGREWLWQTSGHLGFYKDAMYSPMDIDGSNYYLKPMNCPFHIMIYKATLHSYRELPLRWAELGTVYRYERSGTLHGMMRVRGFTQDDAHIICTPEQIDDEILRVLDFSLDMLRTFGFSVFHIALSVRDPKDPGHYAGSDENWQRAEASLVSALTTRGLDYTRMEGEAVFYGPKIDIKIQDALGRTWQCTTIQFDFNLSERFDMKYIGADGAAHRPFMVHRALLGSLERFFGVLTEHYGGFFPLWLAPVQVQLVPISEKQEESARKTLEELRGHGIRAEIDDRREGMRRKIRDAEMQKIPVIAVIGEREAAAGQVSVRVHRHGERGVMPLAQFIERMKIIIEDKSTTYEV